MKKKRYCQIIFGIIVTALLVGFDQLTKYLARTCLAGNRGMSVIPGVFELYYLENRGAAFGMLTNRQWLFAAVAVLMILALVYVYLRLPEDRHYHLLRMVCILIVSGAAGNMIDRIMNHYVTDFLYVALIHFPVFNIADCYVCVGAAAAVVLLFTVYRSEEFRFLFPKFHAPQAGRHQE